MLFSTRPLLILWSPMVLLALCTFLQTATGGVVVLPSASTSQRNASFHAPEWGCLGNVPRRVEAPIFCWHHLQQYTNLTTDALISRINGSIFVIDTSNFFDAILRPVFNQTQREDRLMDWIVSQGAVGAIVWQTAAVEGGSAEVVFNDFEFCKRTPILVLELGKADGKEIDLICTEYATNGTAFRAELTAGDVNNWKNIRRGPFIVLFRVIGTLVSVGTAALALAKYALFVRFLGAQISIPQIILIIHWVSSLFRSIIIALDPIYAGQLFVGYQAHMVSTISLPSLFIATLLLALYWKESMEKSRVQVNKCLGSMKIPFFVLSGVMILVEVINSVLRAIRIGILGLMSTLTAVLYIVVLLTLSFIFFIVGIKILLKLRRSDAMINLTRHSRSKLRLWRLTIFLVVSGVFNLVFIIAWVLGAFEFFLYTPVGFHVFWSLLYASLIWSTLTQVLSIKAPTSPGGLTTKMSSYSLRSGSGALSTDSKGPRSTMTHSHSGDADESDLETGEEDDEDTGSEH